MALAAACAATTAAPSNAAPATSLFVTMIVDSSTLVNSVRLVTVEIVFPSCAVLGAADLAVKSAAVVVVSVRCVMKSLPKRQKRVSE